MIKRLFLFIALCLGSVLWADQNSSLSFEESMKIEEFKQKILVLDESIKDNLWYQRYGNYLTYQKLIDELTSVDAEVKRLRNLKDKISVESYEKLTVKQESLEKQILLLQEFKHSPFTKLTAPIEVDNYPKVTGPFSIIPALSYVKQMKQESNEYKTRMERLDVLVKKLQEKVKLAEEIHTIDPQSMSEEALFEIQKELNAFISAQDIATTSYSLHVKKVEEANIRVTQDITAQVKQALSIGVFIVIVIVIAILLKFVAKRYIKDNERFYLANKMINFANITLIIVILLFSYLENVSYLVTVLGFASAGIAIAMKDWFMSMLGWMVIVFGGSFHVGDRVKVQKDGLSYVGDVVDISLLRMTIFEDVTISTYKENRRAGRIVFIPNNYIFTSLIANYTHGTIRTVWDGIDVFITFDSNHKKAFHLIREIVKKYSKGYTDIARKQLNLLRNQYSLKNTNVEPRIFSFIEPQGLCISAWYMTNAYATLTLRSTISAEIIDAFNKEEDIKIAYPTQNINIASQKKVVPHVETHPMRENEKSLF